MFNLFDRLLTADAESTIPLVIIVILNAYLSAHF